MMYPVNEYFTTIQGEARWTGTPSFFLRLQGCDVGCHWCDTKHTWKLENLIASVSDKTEDTDGYTYLTVESIINLVKESGVKHVVITGGEPATYNLNPLTIGLLEQGFTVQLETSGTYEINCHPNVWVTVSPKENMKGGRSVLDSAISRADEIKYPVGKQRDVEAARKYLGDVRVWLQPLSQSKKATELCVEACLTEGFNLSIQTHKFINVR